jgi:cytochrome c556
MKAVRKWNVAIAALGVVALGTSAMAASSSDVVKERQASMKAQAADLKAVTDYARGKGDKDGALKGAHDLADRAAKASKLFPKGTSSADLPGVSKAKPEIWSDNAKFMTILKGMQDKSSKLGDVIKSGSPDDVKTAATDLAKTGCGACHSSYREAGSQ